jgi:hypothetical protein
MRRYVYSIFVQIFMYLALTILTCIPEVTVSNFDRDTDNLDWGFCGFPQSLKANAGRKYSFSPQSLPLLYFHINY